MIEIVEDTNILIDLFNTGLIRYCQRMDMEFHTTVYVFKEIGDPNQKKFITGLIMNGLLIIDSFEGEDFTVLTNTIKEAKGKNNLSEADWSVILLAERFHCRLLTADQKLAHQARLRGIETNGFLWLTDKMVEQCVVTELEMAEFLQSYKNTNTRIPEPETTNRIKKYRHIE